MKRVIIDGKVCVGPTFTRSEMGMMKHNLTVNASLPHLADLLGVVGNPVRLRIVYLLAAHREMCVCDLAEILQITVSAVSQHLRKLKDKHLVQNRRNGQTIYYALKTNAFNQKLKHFIDTENEVHELTH